MARVRITSSIVGEDRREWYDGEVHECSAAFAAQIVAERRAVLVPDDDVPVERAPVSDPVAVESRDPALTTASAPALTTRRGKR